MEHHSKGNNRASSDAGTITEDLVRLRDDFGEMFNTALELGREYPGEIKDKVEAGVKQLKKMAKHAKAHGAEAVEEIQDTVAARPITSVLVSFGVGVLCGVLLRRK